MQFAALNQVVAAAVVAAGVQQQHMQQQHQQAHQHAAGPSPKAARKVLAPLQVCSLLSLLFFYFVRAQRLLIDTSHVGSSPYREAHCMVARKSSTDNQLFDL